MITLRAQYNYDVDAASEEAALKIFDKSKTQQQFKEEADINTIVKRFHLTGELPTNVRAPHYGDFTQVTDYQTAMNAVVMANEAFMEMPAHVRKRFNNDPALFVEFCSDPQNKDEAIKLGLIELPEQTGSESTAPPSTESPVPQAPPAG